MADQGVRQCCKFWHLRCERIGRFDRVVLGEIDQCSIALDWWYKANASCPLGGPLPQRVEDWGCGLPGAQLPREWLFYPFRSPIDRDSCPRSLLVVPLC